MLLSGTHTLTNQIATLKQEWPGYYRAFFSRIYEDNAKFCDWRLPLYYFSHTYVHVTKKHLSHLTGGEKLNEDSLFNLQVAKEAERHNAPLFFVEPDLFHACARTSIFQGIKIEDLKVPYDSFTFVLPKGALYSQGDEVCFISVMRNRIGEHIEHLGALESKYTTEDEALIVSTLIPARMETLTLRFEDNCLAEIENLEWKDYFTDYTDSKYPHKLNPIDTDLGNTMIKLAVSLILAMQSRPELVTKERKIKQMRRDRTKVLWAPNVIGSSFKVNRVDPASSLEPGTHASPRAHWRSGHYRKVWTGKRIPDCTCEHPRRAHFGEEFEDHEPEARGPANKYSICMLPDCDCKLYAPKESDRSFRIDWFPPVFVCAQK